MASSKPATSKSATAATKTGNPAGSVPTKYKIAKGVLQFATKKDELTKNLISDDAWPTIEPGHGYGKSGVNVGPIIFDGRVILVQKGKSCSCTLTLSQQQYVQWGVKVGPKNDSPAVVQLKCTEERPLTFEGDESAARELPLAKCSNDLHFVKLTMAMNDMTATGTPRPKTFNALGSHLKYLLTGRESVNAESIRGRILHGDFDTLDSESKAQREQLGLLKGVRIVTRLGRAGRTVEVEVFPNPPKELDNPSEVKEFDFSSKLGQSYMLKAEKLFPKTKLKGCPILGVPVTEGWELAVVKNKAQSEAALVGVIRNCFGDSSIDEFIGEESNVSLEPIVNDVLGLRSRKALGKVGDQIDEFSRQALGFLQPDDKSKPRSLLPAEPLYFDEDFDEAKNTLSHSLEIPAEYAEHFNASQLKAIEMALGRKISIVYGPPGTGKSWVLAAMIKLLLNDITEKVIAVASANVAVDALLATCIKLWKEFDPHGIPPFARVFSESQIMTQWASGDHDAIQDDYHIDQIQYREASTGSTAYPGYLAGREELRSFGSFNSEDRYKAYKKDLKELNKVVMTKIRAVFCTVTACQISLLYDEDPVDGRIKSTYGATSIVIDEAGVMLRPQVLIPIMTFKSARRLILAGDPMQLTALILARKSQRWWHQSYLQQLINRKWTWTFLDVQYRMHDVVYDHLVKVIYQKSISSIYKTSSPSPYLQRLQAVLPLRFDSSRDTYSVNSFMHFVDVPEGIRSTKEGGGSSWNEMEVEVVSGLVEALIEAGIDRRTVAVLTGYAEQKRLLELKAEERQWAGIKQIATIDASQGDQCEIVILSLVTTDKTAGFMGKRSRACVGTSRQKEAIYIVGNAKFWLERKEKTGWKWMHHILQAMSCNPGLPAPFLLRSQRFAAVETVVASEPTASTHSPVGRSEVAPVLEDFVEQTPVQKLEAWLVERKQVEEEKKTEGEEAKRQFAAKQEEEKRELEAAIDREFEHLVADNQSHEEALQLTVDFERSLNLGP